MQNWVIATVLATLSGVLIAPISEVDPTSYTLFVVPALGAALIGRFSSFGVTAAAGLLLGVIQSEIVKLQTVFTWLPQQGLGDGVPFVLILVVMTLSAQRLRSRGVLGDWRNPSIGRPARPIATAVLTFVVGRGGHVLPARLGPGRPDGLGRLGLPVPVAGRAHRLRRAGVAGPDVVRRDRRVHAQPPQPELGRPVPVLAADRGGRPRCRWAS